MASNVDIRWDTAKFEAALLPACNKGLTAAATVMAAHASEKVSEKSYPPASFPGEAPARDQGDLERSIRFASPEALGTPLHAAFGTALIYGRKLEFGGVIRAKKGKYLAVPIWREMARKIMRSGGIRGNKLLQFIPSRKGGGVLVLREKVKLWRGRRTGKAGKAGTQTVPAGTAVFALVKQVTIQPRPWIVRAAEESRTRAAEMFAAVTRAELAKTARQLPPAEGGK